MVDEIHIARKQYLDGSIPTGFQRTTIVGVDGTVPYKDRDDPDRPARPGGGRLPRGQRRRPPPDLPHRPAGHAAHRDGHRPRHAHAPGSRPKWARSSAGSSAAPGGSARASAPAREDVNVSVTGGTRIEIKGVPRIPRIPLLTYNEAMRQWNLLRLRDELHRRGITPETFAAVDGGRHQAPAQDPLPARSDGHRRRDGGLRRRASRVPGPAPLADPDRHVLLTRKSPTGSGSSPA